MRSDHAAPDPDLGSQSSILDRRELVSPEHEDEEGDYEEEGVCRL